MPSLKKADIEQINEAVRSGNINAARRILTESDDPRAKEMLAKLNAKHPPPRMAPDADRSAARKSTEEKLPWDEDAPKPVRPVSTLKRPAPAAPADPLTEAKRLIALKDYDAAEKLLWDSDDPAAGDLLRKLALVRSAVTNIEPGKASLPAKPKVKKSSASPLLGFLAALLLVVIIGGGVFLFMKQKEAAELPDKIYDQLLSVCLDLALNNADAARLSNDDLGHACQSIAREYMATYPTIAEQCYLESGGGILEWYGCDARDNTEFNYQYLVDAVNANS